MILVSTTVAYLLYFFLLKHVGPTYTASVTFIIPVFGTLWAVLFLGEPLHASAVLGMVIILASVRLVTGKKHKKQQPAPVGMAAVEKV